MDLADYERRKFDLAAVLSEAVALGKDPGVQSDEIRDLFSRLAEDRFNLVVVGRFSRGKSSLMNAILGMDRLPTSIAPLTSVITAVSYGSQEHVELTFKGRSLPQDIPIAELGQFITQEGNPGNVRQVKVAEIQLPAEILRRGFYFVDTPGLGSAIEQNTETTEAFLPAADAFLLVTGFESPLSGDEVAFLRTAAASAHRVFVAVNKQDAVPDPTERSRAMDFIDDQLRSVFRARPPKTFSVSALEGLRAKLAGDQAALERSGVAALEQALIGFLVTEKTDQFLMQMCARIESVLIDLPGSPEAAALGQRLRTVGEELGLAIAQGAPEGRSATVGGLRPTHSERAGACEICVAIDEATFEFLRHFQYDLTVDKGLQQQLAEDGGLCGLHTWRYHSMASPQGICRAFPELLEQWADKLVGLASGREGSADASRAIDAHRPNASVCPVCRSCAGAEQAALASLTSRLSSPAEVDDLTAICIGHLAMLLPGLPDREVADALLRREAGLLERIAEDMRRYALKFQGLRRSLAGRAEVDAPLRALRIVAGLRNLKFITRPDDLL